MSWRFALMIDPVPLNERRGDDTDDSTDYVDTFTRVDTTSAALSVSEMSTQRGDGVFETIGVIDGHAQELQAHLARLAHSAHICDLPAPNLSQFAQAALIAASGCPRGECVVKLILSRGVDDGPTPTAWVTAAPAADFTRVRRDGVRVVTLDRGYDLQAGERAPWLLLGAKTLSYAVNMAALREARRRGADDAIFVSTDGYVFEAPTASLIVRKGERFLTPAPHGGILQGTTQLSVFSYLQQQGHPTEYATIPASDLATVDGAWLVSSVRLAAPVTAIDGVPVAVDPSLTSQINNYLLKPRT